MVNQLSQQTLKLPLNHADGLTQDTGHLLAPQTAIEGTIENLHEKTEHSDNTQVMHSAGLVTVKLNNGIELYAMKDQIELPAISPTPAIDSTQISSGLTLTHRQPINAFILASDVSICTQAAHHSSIVNHLPAQISKIATDQTHALVTCDADGQLFFASISLYSLHTLQLAIGQTIYLQFKAGAIKRLN